MNKRPKRSAGSKSLKSTFTYYIPSPPSRKSGYREREFDKIFTGILQAGFEIEDLQAQAVSGENGSGLFVVAILRAPNKNVSDLDRGQVIHERFKLDETHSSPDIILEDEVSDDF